MNTYVTGNTIRELREKKKLTQKQLADLLAVSDKTISKWETQKGLPDITLLEPLASVLSVSVAELLSGDCAANMNRSSNLQKSVFYVCPVCGNIVHAVGEGSFSCCGITLPSLSPEDPDEDHVICVEKVENEHFVSINHPMSKDHYISFIALVTGDRIYMHKMYPEQNAEVRFPMCGHGYLYAYCNHHGLYRVRI